MLGVWETQPTMSRNSEPETGLEILSREGMTKSIVEGDSMLVINTVRRLQNGTRVGNI